MEIRISMVVCIRMPFPFSFEYFSACLLFARFIQLLFETKRQSEREWESNICFHFMICLFCVYFSSHIDLVLFSVYITFFLLLWFASSCRIDFIMRYAYHLPFHYWAFCTMAKICVDGGAVKKRTHTHIHRPTTRPRHPADAFAMYFESASAWNCV